MLCHQALQRIQRTHRLPASKGLPGLMRPKERAQQRPPLPQRTAYPRRRWQHSTGARTAMAGRNQLQPARACRVLPIEQSFWKCCCAASRPTRLLRLQCGCVGGDEAKNNDAAARPWHRRSRHAHPGRGGRPKPHAVATGAGVAQKGPSEGADPALTPQAVKHPQFLLTWTSIACHDAGPADSGCASCRWSA